MLPLPVDTSDDILDTVHKRSGLPVGSKCIRKLGKGANNIVFLHTARGGEYFVARRPRANGDTQRRDVSEVEFRHTLLASHCDVAPPVYDAWFVRHKTDDMRSGLHMLCGYFPHDLQRLIEDEPMRLHRMSSEVAESVYTRLSAMADADMFCYDIKASNMVMRDDPVVDVRFIDFGGEYCEVAAYTDPDNDATRTLNLMRRMARDGATERYPAAALYRDLILWTMIVMLAANVTHSVESSKAAARCVVQGADGVNFMRPVVADVRGHIRGKHVRMIRDILRVKDVRYTLRHYMGRRNSGTERCLEYAGFRLHPDVRPPSLG